LINYKYNWGKQPFSYHTKQRIFTSCGNKHNKHGLLRIKWMISHAVLWNTPVVNILILPLNRNLYLYSPKKFLDK
jgi:hypothetical protein